MAGWMLITILHRPKCHQRLFATTGIATPYVARVERAAVATEIDPLGLGRVFLVFRFP